MNHLDLFSGIGGFALGLSWAGNFRTIGFAECDNYSQRVLQKHWPDVPIWGDVKDVDYDGSVDIITGGYPCQPFSTAKHGVKSKEINLWPSFKQVINKYKPKYIIAENVSRTPQKQAKRDLKKDGYKTELLHIGANDAGAPHRRNRWWLCAYPDDESELSSAINAKTSELPKLCGSIWGAENYARAVRVPNGISNRMDRLKGLGNAVVPQIPMILGQAIHEIENG